MDVPLCEVPAVKFVQRDRVMFTAAIPAVAVLAISRVDIFDSRTEEGKLGYQRRPDPRRVRQIADYISRKDAFFPTGGLLNSRIPEGEPDSPLRFLPDDAGALGPIQSGRLQLFVRPEYLHVVDMQHRLEGIRSALEGGRNLEDFPVMCTIASGLSREEEIRQFELINTSQKKVSTGLANRVLASITVSVADEVKLQEVGKLWKVRAVKVTSWLFENSSIWKGAILPPNVSRREMPSMLATETSFVTSLRPVMETPLFQRTKPQSVAQYLEVYWLAVRALWPSAFEDLRKSVIYKTSGIYPLHALMPDAFHRASQGAELPQLRDYSRVLQPWTEFGPDFWLRDYPDGPANWGTSGAAFSKTAEHLRRSLRSGD